MLARQRGEERLKSRRIVRHQGRRALELYFDGDGIEAELGSLLFGVGLRNRQRIVDDRLRARREPVVEAAVERKAGGKREQHRRGGGYQAEQRDNADMQTGGGAALA